MWLLPLLVPMLLLLLEGRAAVMQPASAMLAAAVLPRAPPALAPAGRQLESPPALLPPDLLLELVALRRLPRSAACNLCYAADLVPSNLDTQVSDHGARAALL